MGWVPGASLLLPLQGLHPTPSLLPGSNPIAAFRDSSIRPSVVYPPQDTINLTLPLAFSEHFSMAPGPAGESTSSPQWLVSSLWSRPFQPGTRGFALLSTPEGFLGPPLPTPHWTVNPRRAGPGLFQSSLGLQLGGSRSCGTVCGRKIGKKAGRKEGREEEKKREKEEEREEDF